jgi:hypothetical protein
MGKRLLTWLRNLLRAAISRTGVMLDLLFPLTITQPVGLLKVNILASGD